MTIPTDNDLNNLNTSVAKWESLQGQAHAEHEKIMQELAALVAEMKADPNNYQATNQAYVTATVTIMCELLQPQGSKLEVLGATLGISAALQNFLAKMQEDANNVSSTAQTNSTDIAAQVKIIQDPSSSSAEVTLAKATIATLMQKAAPDAQSLVEHLNDLLGALQGTTPWIDSNTKGSITGSAQNIASLLNLGTSLPDSAMNETTLVQAGNAASLTLAEWTAQPVTTPPKQGATPPSNTSTAGSQQFQNLYAAFNAANEQVTTQSNSAQTQVQVAAATYNQDQQITEKAIMSTITSENTIQQKSGN